MESRIARVTVEKRIVEERQRIEEQILVQVTDYQRGMIQMTHEIEVNSNALKAELEWTKMQGKIEKEKELETARKKVIDMLVEQQTSKEVQKYWIISILFFVVAIAFLDFGIWQTCRYISSLSEPLDENIIKVIGGGAQITVGLISRFFKTFIIDNVFCGLKYAVIKEKVRRKIENQYLIGYAKNNNYERKRRVQYFTKKTLL